MSELTDEELVNKLIMSLEGVASKGYENTNFVQVVFDTKAELLSRLTRGREAEAKVRQLEKMTYQDNALLEAIDDYITKGQEPCDFFLSFGVVDNVYRKITDLQQQLKETEELVEKLKQEKSDLIMQYCISEDDIILKQEYEKVKK